ncbi:uncharacterized protein LOC123680109 [Harmonia axyridis]|uniref:uncharacterized protein LOC123680109 n=1 Tax=Harmonia axyridis TaxID=115357 RepID=UPI001E277CBE|nr:uncharacterized protein LOC123680109 [Harmonia axyridis]
MRMLLLICFIWAAASASVLISNIPGDNSDYVHSGHGHILHRLRREHVPTKTPEVIKYYDADSIVSRVTVMSRNGISLEHPLVYENTAFKADSDGNLVKSPKEAEPEKQEKKEEKEVV